MINENFIKDVNKEIDFTNKIRYIIIMKIMYWLVKICKKKMIKQKINIKIKNKDDYVNKEHVYKALQRGLSTAKISK